MKSPRFRTSLLLANLLSVPILLGALPFARAQDATPTQPAISQSEFNAQVTAAQRFIDDEKYDEAQTIIDRMIAAQPQNYALYLMQASAYIGRYYQTDPAPDELKLLTQARTSIIKSKSLANGNKDLVSASDSLMEIVESELKDLQTDEASDAPIEPPHAKPAPVAPRPAVSKPAKTQPAGGKPAPVKPRPIPAPPVATVPVAAAPVAPTPGGPLVLPSGMTSNIPLSLPGPATPPSTSDPLILAKEIKNRKYPTHTVYDELAASYVQLGMYDEAARNFRTNAQIYQRANQDQAAVIHEQYAERYENQVRLFADRPLTSTELAALDTHATIEPPVGTYLGAFIDRDDRLKTTWTSEYFQTHHDPDEFGKVVGKDHATVFMYARYGGPFPGEWLQHCKDEGVIPQIAWEPQDGLNAVQQDAYLVDFAKACGKMNWPIFLRFASEMNGTWTKWAGNPALYREKFALVNRVFKQYAPRVATIWCVNCIPVANIPDYYPGDENCDWVGINLYSVPFYSDNSTDKPGDLDSPSNFIQPIYDMFKDRKPIALCEYASSQMHHAENKPRIDFAVNKMSLLYDSLPRLFPHIKMVSWFDQNNIKFAPEFRRVNNFSLTENGIVLSAYQGLTSSPYFISGGEGLNDNVTQNAARPVPCPIVPGQSMKGVTRFSIWVKTPIQRPLVYLQIGNKIVYAGKRPGANVVDIDTSQIPKGRQPVTVYVYSDAGKFVSKQVTSLTFGPTRGDDTAPLYASGIIKDYDVDRTGYVTALTLQTMGSEAYVHFAPEMAAQLLEQFPVNGAFAGWLKPDPDNGPGHWILVSLDPEKPAAGLRKVLPTDLARLSQEPVVDADAVEIPLGGILTGVVADENDRILALRLDNNTLVRIPPALRAVPDPNPVVLTRGAQITVTAKPESPLEGAVSALGTHWVATDIEVAGLKASAVGLPLITLKESREISGVAAPGKLRGAAAHDLKSESFTLYVPPAPKDNNVKPTRGGGLPAIFPENARPW